LLNGSIFRRPYSVVRDQNIKPPKTLNGSFDQFLRCSSAGKIAVDGRTVLFPQFFDQPFRLRLGFFVIEHDASPSRHEHPDRRRERHKLSRCCLFSRQCRLRRQISLRNSKRKTSAKPAWKSWQISRFTPHRDIYRRSPTLPPRSQ